MEVGDPCFAHVRSFPWWPAKVVKKFVSKSKEKSDKFQVIFYGTGETAQLPLKELAIISPDQVLKFSAPAAMRRKFFKEGMLEMKAEFPWISKLAESSSKNSVSRPVIDPVVKPISIKKANMVGGQVTWKVAKPSPLKEITNSNSE